MAGLEQEGLEGNTQRLELSENQTFKESLLIAENIKKIYDILDSYAEKEVVLESQWGPQTPDDLRKIVKQVESKPSEIDFIPPELKQAWRHLFEKVAQ
jgi:hypothetical protein